MAGPALKRLGSLRPGAATSTVVYTVPAATTAVVSKLIITNDSATATTVFVSVVTAADVTCAAKNSVVNGVTIAGNDFAEVLQGVTLGAGDFVCVQAVLATVNFNLFGQENS